MATLGLYREPQQLLPFDGTAVLFNNFLNEEFTRDAFNFLYANVMFGKKHKQACLSTWHSDDGVSYVYSGIERVAHPMNATLDSIRQSCESAVSTKFNSVLVNFYRDGSAGMGWHADNEAINGREPIIASVSLGATRRFNLRHRETKQTVKVDLENGSLLVMSGLSQQCWVHQVAKTAKPVGPRINLTFRLVRAD